MTKILFFGPVRDAAGCAEMEVELPPGVDTLARLRDWLSARDPHLSDAIRSRTIRVAVDQAFVAHDAALERPEEIAFMSPLSGG